MFEFTTPVEALQQTALQQKMEDERAKMNSTMVNINMQEPKPSPTAAVCLLLLE